MGSYAEISPQYLPDKDTTEEYLLGKIEYLTVLKKIRSEIRVVSFEKYENTKYRVIKND
jgi:hypothetical protein